jgi:hypothetical protein
MSSAAAYRWGRMIARRRVSSQAPRSLSAIHQHLATIIGVLERQRALNVHSNGQDELVLTSSATQMAHAA